MVFYRLRLCFSVMRPTGTGGPDSLPLKSSANWAYIHTSEEEKLISSRTAWVLSLRGSTDISKKKVNAAAMFVLGWVWVWGWCVNGGTVPMSAAVLAWQQKGAGCIGPSDIVPTPHCLWERHFIVPSRHSGTKPRVPHSWRWQGAFILNAWLVQALFCPVSHKNPLPTSRPVSDKRRVEHFTLYCLD